MTSPILPSESRTVVNSDGTPAIRTVGHSTLGAEEFAALVGSMAVDVVVDVRAFPGSRRLPHFSEAELAAWLPDHGMAYRWLPVLGGRRRATAGSPNVGLRNAQFRAYADHMRSHEFLEGVAELDRVAVDRVVAVMCAEAVWWRCHRRLLADHLVMVAQRPVEHGFPDGRLVAHQPLPEARRVGDHLVYDLVGG